MKAWLLVPLALAGCAAKTLPPKVEYQTVYVPTTAPCPDVKILNDLIDTRPVPLRMTDKPADASVRSAKSQAQLGRYEAEGGWADRVVAALKRCGVE